MSTSEYSLDVTLSCTAIIAPQNRAERADNRTLTLRLIFLFHLRARRRHLVPSSPTADLFLFRKLYKTDLHRLLNPEALADHLTLAIASSNGHFSFLFFFSASPTAGNPGRRLTPPPLRSTHSPLFYLLLEPNKSGNLFLLLI